MKRTRDYILFYLNGKRHAIGPDHASMMLADYLRYQKQLTGTKVVCAEGDCGACSVLKLNTLSREPRSQRFLPINSCIATVAQMDGSFCVTVDALSENGELTPVQSAMVKSNGSQCGFCTPGFVVALTGLVEKKLCNKKPATNCTPTEAKNACTGNLCRCTGYQPIIDAAVAVDLKKCTPVKKRFLNSAQTADLKKVTQTAVYLENENYSFYAPTTVKEASNYLKKNKGVRILASATDLGVVHNKGKIKLNRLMSLHLIPELYQIKIGKRVSVGARVTLAELRDALKKRVPEFARFLDLFASPQIKNTATLVGNVTNASPIADTPPFLLVANAIVHIANGSKKRKVPLDRFYLSYRKTDLKPGEFVSSIDFDIPTKNETTKIYKTSQRKDLDISAMNAAFRIKWKPGSPIQEIKLAMGGIAATPLRLKKTEAFLKGKTVDSSILNKAIEILHSEMNPLSDLRGSATFRRLLVENTFKKFFRENGVSK